MKFNEWLKKVEELQNKIESIAIVPVTESIFINGKTVLVSLTSTQLEVELDGNRTAPRFLRHEYTHAKEEFADLLDALTSDARELLDNANEMLMAVTEEEIPEAVIARMKGDQVDGDTLQLLNRMVSKKWEVLVKRFARVVEPFEWFEIELPVAGQGLQLIKSGRGSRVSLAWGGFVANEGNSSQTSAAGSLKFLGAYKAIEEKLERACILIEPFKSLKEG